MLIGDEGRTFIARLCVCLLTCLMAMTIHYELYTREGLSRVWFYWENIEIHEEMCTVDMPPFIQNVFMPPVDCSHCENLTHVPRISDVSPILFEKMYAYSGTPVIVTDATENWTAMEVFSYDFFKDVYKKDSPALSNFKVDCQFFPYNTQFKNLSQVFHMPYEKAVLFEGREPWYVGWGNCDPNVANLLRKHYTRPYFIPEHSETSKMDWIFMGTPGYGANLHIDKVNYPSWQAQIRGRKRWTLEPIPECYSSCKTLEAVVETGDIIAVDTNLWYHKTLVIDDEMSIAIGSEFD
ncbi:uncharacterized protein LOC111624676 [Centruroides sculpturatus]|uniref:uncharacterized protein LOC111624676 n=1 Tax=Centruroides sculpturatus TaxID=218467 RepID=UPI000C6E7398|nr:uncharacterized protein LOC111624676 [Centruroides sculpturatus]